MGVALSLSLSSRNRVSVKKDETASVKRALVVLLLIAVFFLTLIEVGKACMCFA